MAHTRGGSESTPDSDPLTSTISGILALVAALGFLYCLGYAVWWLAVYWAP